jgi:7-carboxy-7-deazaguanine synthase
MDAAAASAHSSHSAMRITEIYASIQGETQYAGLPCTLVRTTGCDLRCSYCDTAYAFSGGREMTVDEVMAEVRRLGISFVTLTGGEPMLQHDIVLLCERLLAEGFLVAIETSGAHPLDSLPSSVVRIVDIKTPGSGEVERNHWEGLATLGHRDAVKFVLCDEADYQWAIQVMRKRGLAGQTEVLFSPVIGKFDPRDLATWIVRDRLPVRLNIQLHKFIWGMDAQGV